jgi:glycosyltransferase involved in cell wall biosynthesis
MRWRGYNIMRICCVIASLGTGGAERVMSNLANYWVSSGHEVTLITLSREAPFYPLEAAINVQQLGQTTEGPCGIIGRLWAIVRRLWALRSAIKKDRPDVVLSFVDIMNVTTLLACIGLPAPVIVSERTDPAFHEIPWLYKRLRTGLYRRAKAVVMQTKSAAAYFEKLSNVTIIPNVVRKMERAGREFSADKKHIISVGRLEAQKDFHTLIKAFAQTLPAMTNATLTIYGEGSQRPQLNDLIAALNLQNCVRLPGVCTDVNAILKTADLFVFPSLYEGFPNALCEAMAAGLPVIASNCAGSADVVQDKINGRLFPVGDVDALAALIIELFGDAEQCKKLASEATELSNQYSEHEVYKCWDLLIDR